MSFLGAPKMKDPMASIVGIIALAIVILMQVSILLGVVLPLITATH